jgi:hypothetical protein
MVLRPAAILAAGVGLGPSGSALTVGEVAIPSGVLESEDLAAFMLEKQIHLEGGVPGLGLLLGCFRAGENQETESEYDDD